MNEHIGITAAVVGLAAFLALASNSAWLPRRYSLIRWVIGKDAVIANAEVNRDGAAITTAGDQGIFVFGSTFHKPKYLIVMGCAWDCAPRARKGEVIRVDADCRIVM